MRKYIKEFTVPYYDSDKNGTAYPASLLAYMEETSSFHSDDLGVGVDELRKKNYGWMLNRWNVSLHRYPKVREKIFVETLATGFDKFYATREFVIYDTDKSIIGQATTLWIFLDIVRKRPIRIPKEFYEAYNIVNENQPPYDFYNFNFEFATETSIDFHVRKTDIDYNNHVNNVKYLNWMLEVIPDEVDNDYYLTEFDIQYKKEIKLGDLIESSISEGMTRDDKRIYLHKINTIDSNDVNTYGRTVWKKR